MDCLQVLNLTQTDNFINLSSFLPFFFIVEFKYIKFHVQSIEYVTSFTMCLISILIFIVHKKIGLFFWRFHSEIL